MPLPICFKCGKTIYSTESKVTKQDKLVGKVVEHLVCPVNPRVYTG